MEDFIFLSEKEFKIAIIKKTRVRRKFIKASQNDTRKLDNQRDTTKLRQTNGLMRENRNQNF